VLGNEGIDVHDGKDPIGFDSMTWPAAVVSGEGVAFELPRAGIGSRTVAALIDLIGQFLAFVFLIFVDGRVAVGADPAAITALLILEYVLVFAGYPILSEWLGRGRTVGKLCLGLRVVRDDGGPIGFRHALVRGLSSLVLEKPGLFAPLGTAAGFITAAVNPREKRVGDLLAGTFVLNERSGTTRRPVTVDYYAVPPTLVPWAAALDLSRLDDRLALGLRQFVTRAGAMTPAAGHALGEQLRAAVLAVVSPPPPPGVPTPVLLTTVLAERRRRAAPPVPGPPVPGWPVAGPIGGWPDQPPPVPPRPPVPPTATPPDQGGPFAPPS
jgi:uncharacterized RDD family membrane protein YckC